MATVTVTPGYSWSSGEIVTPAKMNLAAAPAVTAVVADGEITTAKILNASVTQQKLAANVAATGPAFRAHANAVTTLTNNDETKIDLGAKSFDTGSFFNTSTSRFQPTVAGYYWFNGAILVPTGANLFCAFLYKGASVAAIGVQSDVAAYRATVSDIIYLNGANDFVEMRAYHLSGTTKSTGDGAVNTYLAGCLMRAA
jgi:hypothetical protein